MAKEKAKLQNMETGEDVNLTLRELRDVARGKAVMMMKEVQDLNAENHVLTKREIPDKLVQCFQCLAEVLILEERIFAELTKLVKEDQSEGLFDQFKEFSQALTPDASEEDQKADAKEKKTTKKKASKTVTIEGVPVDVEGTVEQKD